MSVAGLRAAAAIGIGRPVKVSVGNYIYITANVCIINKRCFVKQQNGNKTIYFFLPPLGLIIRTRRPWA